jgi:hypothetical protein
MNSHSTGIVLNKYFKIFFAIPYSHISMGGAGPYLQVQFLCCYIYLYQNIVKQVGLVIIISKSLFVGRHFTLEDISNDGLYQISSSLTLKSWEFSLLQSKLLWLTMRLYCQALLVENRICLNSFILNSQRLKWRAPMVPWRSSMTQRS